MENKKYKDSVFRKIFNDKEKIIELYNALSESSYGNDTNVEIVTLEDVLYDVFKNDLAFIIGNKFVVLVEHQSTINENMPIRMLIYLAREYEKIIKNDNVYKSTLVKIPEPELYVLYNGIRKYNKTELKLSDAFITNNKNNSFINLKVKVININIEKNHKVLALSRTLKEYGILIQKIRKLLDDGNTLENALKSAIKECISNNILKDFLKQNSSEVINMLFQEFDVDKYIKVREEEAEQKGLEKGLEKGKVETAKNALLMGLDIEQIEKLTGLNKEKILSLK